MDSRSHFENIKNIHQQKVEAFLFIRAWGHDVGWRPYRIETELDNARQYKAPSNAVHMDPVSKRWVTLDDLTPDVKARLEEYVSKEYGQPNG